MNRNNTSFNKQIAKIQKKAVGAIRQASAKQTSTNKQTTTKNKQQKTKQRPSVSKNHGIKKKNK